MSSKKYLKLWKFLGDLRPTVFCEKVKATDITIRLLGISLFTYSSSRFLLRGKVNVQLFSKLALGVREQSCGL